MNLKRKRGPKTKRREGADILLGGSRQTGLDSIIHEQVGGKKGPFVILQKLGVESAIEANFLKPLLRLHNIAKVSVDAGEIVRNAEMQKHHHSLI